MAKELFRTDTNLKPSEIKAAFERSRNIDQQLDKERENQKKEVQLLILGAGGSGKSTFSRQLRILYGDGFTAEEKRDYRHLVHSNIRTAVERIVCGMNELGLQLVDPALQHLQHDIREREDNNNENVLSTRFAALSQFWSEPSVQVCYQKRNQLHIDDSVKYFFEEIGRISSPDYLPTLEDILHVRKRTEGVQEIKVSVNNLKFRIIDAGGQQNQRKKWIHLFEGVTAVVFFVSLSSYDEELEENRATNSMIDSLELFHEISSSPYLERTDFLLFLNKHDIFVEKIKTSQLTACFSEYEGGSHPEKALNYIREQFLARKPEKKRVHVHVTCATDTDLMKPVLKDVFEILVDINLKQMSTL